MRRGGLGRATPPGWDTATPETLQTLLAAVEQWLATRTISSIGRPLSLHDRRRSWCAPAQGCVGPDARGVVRERLIDMDYLTVALDLHADAAIQRVILQRFLNDPSVQWMDAENGRAWSARLDGRESFRFTVFTPLACIALGNTLCMLGDVRAGHLKPERWPAAEFLRRAMRHQKDLTLGDLLAAHVLVEAFRDLRAEIEKALDEATRRRWLDYLWPWGHRAKAAAAGRLSRWLRGRLAKYGTRLSPAELLWDEHAAWDPSAVAPLLATVATDPAGAAVRRWLAWRIAQRLCPGGAATRAPLETLALLLRPSAPPAAWAFAAQTVLEVITGVPREEAEPFFQRFLDENGNSVLAPVCGQITYLASQAAARRADDGGHSGTWDRWSRTMSRLLWTAIRSGQLGQVFVGQFLFQLACRLGTEPLASVSARVPEMRLPRLCREWFRLSLGAAEGTPDGYGALLKALQTTLTAQHGDMHRTFNVQKALRKTQGRRQLAGGKHESHGGCRAAGPRGATAEPGGV